MLLLLWFVGVDLAEVDTFATNMNATREVIERTLFLSLDPHMQIVVAEGNILYVEHTLLIGKAIIRRRQRYHHGAHLRMNVAKDVGDALARKNYAARRAGLIEPEVKTPAIEERKYVVKKRIFIGKRNSASHWHNQQVWNEHLVLL